MSWQTHRRAAFHPAGPFLFKRNGRCGDLEVHFGDVITADELRAAGNTDRHIERLYNGYWMDMASPDALLLDKPAKPAKAAPAPTPEPDAPPPAADTEPPAADEDGDADPEHGEAVGYRHIGFGRYVAEDANGVQFGPKIKKVEAEQSAKPILPQAQG